MWGLIKVIGVGIGILMTWAAAGAAEKWEQKQRNEEFEEHLREGLEETAQKRYGRPYDTLDEEERQAVFDEFTSQW